MFKQSVSSEKANESKNIINQLGAVTAEQHAEFAKLTGRGNVDFKVGKPSDATAERSIQFKVGKPAMQA